MNRLAEIQTRATETSNALIEQLDAEMPAMSRDELWAAFTAGFELGLEGYIRMGKALHYLSKLGEDLQEVPITSSLLDTLLRVGGNQAVPSLVFELRTEPALQSVVARLNKLDQERLARDPILDCVVIDSRTGLRSTRKVHIEEMGPDMRRQVFCKGRIRSTSMQQSYLTLMERKKTAPMAQAVRRVRGGFIVDGRFMLDAVIEQCYRQIHP